MKQNVLSTDNLLSLTARGRLTFLKKKTSNYGSVSGILEMEFWNWWAVLHQFQNSISKILVSSKVGLIPKFPFQNSSILKGGANSKIPNTEP